MIAEVETGRVLDGRYELVELIHRAGMASIYKARDLKTRATVAVKVPHVKLELEIESYNRFMREEDIGRVLDHPAIVKIIPVEGRKSRPYLVMEYLEGRTLHQRMQGGTPLPEAEAARIGSRICEGLEHMHAHGIVHRDLKPENIMLCADGGLRIIDFGIAKAAGMKRITYLALSSMWGTPDYMAPEQVNGGRGDARSDLYSLGAVLYEMTTGRVPFEGENPLVVMHARTSGDPVAPRQVNDRLSPEIEEIILHAMERDPKDRFESATEMRGELEDYRIVKLLGRYRHLQPPQPRHVGGNLKVVYLILFFVLLQLAVFGLTLWHFSGRRH